MLNLEQVRARNALASIKNYPNLRGKGGEEAGKGGDIVSGFPALIRTNGLLAVAALCESEGSQSGHFGVACAIADHLTSPEIARWKPDQQQPSTCTGLIAHLTKSDSMELRLCTGEALAFLDYLKRFAKAKDRTEEAHKKSQP